MVQLVPNVGTKRNKQKKFRHFPMQPVCHNTKSRSQNYFRSGFHYLYSEHPNYLLQFHGFNCLKKSLPLSSTRINAGKSSTPDSLHTEFGIFHTLDALDIVLRQNSCRTTDRTEIETAVLLAGVCDLLAAVTFGKHNHAAAMTLEEVYVGVHTSGSCRAH